MARAAESALAELPPVKRSALGQAFGKYSLQAFLQDPTGLTTERGAAFQRRCCQQSHGTKKVVIIVVGGKTKLWKVNQTIAEAFNVGQGSFKYEPLKGATVLESHFLITRPG